MDSLLEKEEAHKIIGEIYKITNLITNKMYIGQTRSHYLNNGKYRPFGHMGRFKSHISESKNISKYNACRYLNSAFNKYGVENFKCELIINCEIKELDDYEKKYIYVGVSVDQELDAVVEAPLQQISICKLWCWATCLTSRVQRSFLAITGFVCGFGVEFENY